MFSSTRGSQCDSEYYKIPGYIIEDESNDTSHEMGTLEAIDSEILGDYDACLYAGELLASEECYARYLKNMPNARNKTRCNSEDRRP
jgi:hypothetical protein